MVRAATGEAVETATVIQPRRKKARRHGQGGPAGGHPMVDAQHIPRGIKRRIEAADARGAHAVEAAVLISIQHEFYGAPKGPGCESRGNHLVAEEAASVATTESILVERDVRFREPQGLGEHGKNQGLPLIAPVDMAMPRLIEMGEGVLWLEGEVKR